MRPTRQDSDVSQYQDLLRRLDRLELSSGIVPVLFDSVDTQQNTGSTSFVDLATVGPKVAITNPGTWLIGWGARIGNTTANTSNQVGLSFNTGAVAAANLIDKYSVTAVSSLTDFENNARFKSFTLAANDEVRLRYKTSAGSGVFEARWIAAVRIA